MTNSTSTEDLIRRWIVVEAPTSAPEGLRDDIVAVTARMRPRPAWVARWKGNHMDVIVGGRARQRVGLVPVLVAIALVVALLGAAAIGAQLVRLPGPPPVPTRIALPGPGAQVALGPDGVWASTTKAAGLPDLAGIHRIDPTTNALSARVSGFPVGHVTFVAVGDAIVASHDEGSQAIVWDATTGREKFKVDLGSMPLEPIAAFGSSWHPNYRSGSISRVDPAAGSATSIALGWAEGPRALGAGPDRVWAVEPAGRFAAIDPITNAVGSEGTVPFQACGIGQAVDRVWVLACANEGVEAIDISTAGSVGRFTSPDRPFAVFEHAGRAWFLATAAGTSKVRLLGVDPVSLRVVATYDTGVEAASESVALGFGSVWIASQSVVLRIPFEALPAR